MHSRFCFYLPNALISIKLCCAELVVSLWVTRSDRMAFSRYLKELEKALMAAADAIESTKGVLVNKPRLSVE